LPSALAYRIGRVRDQEPAELTAVVARLATEKDAVAWSAQKILSDNDIHLQPLATVDEYARSVYRELAAAG